MFKCLEKMNYPEEYIRFIKLIYQETYSQVQYNGCFLECLKLERGVRQGCPVSFPLYCTQNDILTNSINKDKNIKGFKLRGRKENLKRPNILTIPALHPLTFPIYHSFSNNFQNIKKQ